MAAPKKTKKTQENINNKLALVMKSGKYTLGYKTVLKSLRSSKGKLILISNNCPPLRKSEIEYYAMLSKVSVHHFHGSECLISMIQCTICGLFYWYFDDDLACDFSGFFFFLIKVFVHFAWSACFSPLACV
ncbi:hypothetical protein AAG906_038708 [Vitis piasezkii]